MNVKHPIILTLLISILAACAPQSTPPTPTAAPAPVRFQTAAGEFEHTWTRLVQGVNGTIAPPGSMVLLVGLRKPDGSPIDLQAFHDAPMEIFVRGEDGSRIMSTMGGFVGPEHADFAIGFMVPEEVKPYVLEWGDNPTIEIVPE